MKRTNCRKFVVCLITVIAVLISTCCACGTLVAYAEGNYKVSFYSGGELFCVVDVIDGSYTVPSEIPQGAEGSEFLGWSLPGSIGYLKAGETYQADNDLSIYAVWSAPSEAEMLVAEEDDSWNPDPILLTLLIVAALVFIALIFVTIWCGVLKRKITDLFKIKRK